MGRTNITVADALNQPGGAQRVLYSGLEALVPLAEVRQLVEDLRAMPTTDVLYLAAMVSANLSRSVTRMKARKLTQGEAADHVHDMAIWFACEVWAGRANLQLATPSTDGTVESRPGNQDPEGRDR